MDQEKEFCIYHELDSTQFLVNTTFDHDSGEFKLTYKFWSEQINGYIEATLTWHSDMESDYEKMFDKFKSKEYCQFFKDGTEAKFFGGTPQG